MEEPANSSGKKILTQTRCNLLSGCQHLECSELPSPRILEVTLICNLFLQLSPEFRFWLPGGWSSGYDSGTSGSGYFRVQIESSGDPRESVQVQPHRPHLHIPSALALGNRHGLRMASKVQGWEMWGWGELKGDVRVFLVLRPHIVCHTHTRTHTFTCRHTHLLPLLLSCSANGESLLGQVSHHS